MKKYLDQRQGDVNLFKPKSIPEGLVKVEPDKNGKTVLVEGEVTGHTHAFYTSTPIYEHKESGRRFVLLSGGKDNTILLQDWKDDYKYHLDRSRSETYTEMCKAHYEALRQEIEALKDPGSFTLLRHEEHWGNLIPNGVEIGRQFEEDWNEDLRRVAD